MRCQGAPGDIGKSSVALDGRREDEKQSSTGGCGDLFCCGYGTRALLRLRPRRLSALDGWRAEEDGGALEVSFRVVRLALSAPVSGR
ncbi:unnamed protein product [Heligmosomoides polygyrus]|uniref:Uncharacterized protein n=1 Tax=Heligmosomoides polygyrus TaxID=6339 RepID=A0A183G208_HELPZ|nr:unnamed protein product [Heligmosomoides polygyrus]